MSNEKGARLHSAWSLPRGRVLRRALRNDSSQEYLAYVPREVSAHPRVLVAINGMSQNALEQAAVFSELCDRTGMILVAPVFTVEQHPDYQRLGRRGRGSRVDLLLNRHLEEIAWQTGADVTQFYLFGFSAGAQFAHRYLMAHPHRVAGAVIAASGWYTFPDNTQRYPYGIRPVRNLMDVNFNPEQFLRVPVRVLIGGNDRGLTNLRATDRTNRQQGKTRLERARNWVAEMRASAQAFGLEPQVTLAEVPGIDHSFTEFCRSGALVEQVESSVKFDAERVAAAAAAGPR